MREIQKILTQEFQKLEVEERMFLSKCAVCNSKIYRLNKEQGAKRLLRNVGTKPLLNKISLMVDFSF